MRCRVMRRCCSNGVGVFRMSSEDILLRSRNKTINFYCRNCGSHSLNQCVTIALIPEMYFVCGRCGARFKLTKGLVYDALIRDRLVTQNMLDLKSKIIMTEDLA